MSEPDTSRSLWDMAANEIAALPKGTKVYAVRDGKHVATYVIGDYIEHPSPPDFRLTRKPADPRHSRGSSDFKEQQ